MPRTPVCASHRLIRWGAVAALLLSSVACTGGTNAPAAEDALSPADAPVTDGSGVSAPSRALLATTTPSTQSGSAPVQAAEAPPDPARALAHVQELAGEIGPRPAGSTEERRAAAYIEEVLSTAGYATEIDEFEFHTQRDRSAVSLPDGRSTAAYAMRGSPNAEVSGIAVHAGLGSTADIAGADLSGKVVVLDRGSVTFSEKARAAAGGGAVAAIVVNDEPGPFLGSLGEMVSPIPVVSVAGEEREALLAAVGSSITVRTDSGPVTATSQNVIARRGDSCHAYLGAHYDSVPSSPGANDNASGTAVVLEIARTNPVDGLCIVLFGAEEVGLFGSQHHVASNFAGLARFMLNVDMAGRADGPIVVGDGSLTTAILEGIARAGVQSSLRRGSFPPFTSSDHVSFTSVGVPAVTFNSGEDSALHTPGDTVDRVDPGALAMFLASIDAALDALVGHHADVLGR